MPEILGSTLETLQAAREGSALVPLWASLSMSRLARRKWPKWFTPNLSKRQTGVKFDTIDEYCDLHSSDSDACSQAWSNAEFDQLHVRQEPGKTMISEQLEIFTLIGQVWAWLNQYDGCKWDAISANRHACSQDISLSYLPTAACQLESGSRMRYP